MKLEDEIEVVRGSGNIYADVGFPDAEARLMKGKIAIAIIKQQDALKLTARAAAKLAGCDPADIQRIRNADWSKFTIDRLLKYATRMGCKIELNITIPKAA